MHIHLAEDLARRLVELLFAPGVQDCQGLANNLYHEVPQKRTGRHRRDWYFIANNQRQHRTWHIQEDVLPYGPTSLEENAPS